MRGDLFSNGVGVAQSKVSECFLAHIPNILQDITRIAEGNICYDFVMDKATKNLTNIIFDFDYTLADSSQGVLSCINYALTGLGFPETTYDVSCRTIGLSFLETYSTLTGRPAQEGEEFIHLFIERAEVVMADMTRLFDGTPGVVHSLNQLGLRLGIVSTKLRYLIETILERVGLFSYFDVIVGGEDVLNHKPNPESLLLAMAKLEATPQNAVYVGDSVVDAKTAEAVGMPFIAVLSGVTPPDAFDDLPSIQILDSIRDLPTFINNSGYSVEKS